MPAERSQQIEQLYHAARELDARQRDAFLQQACAGDEALRQEVESLLAQDDGVESFLEMPALQALRNMSDEDPGQSMTGRQLGPYQCLALLGKGGMGEVYRARDTQLQRDVALKLLPGVFASDPIRLARFQREAEVLASLNHPNIAQIYGLEGTVGSRCIVMELVEGNTLQERLKRGPIPVGEALLIMKQIADALEAAHEKDIIHRDLKPANVKITPEGRVKVLDFGLAKPLDEPNQDFSNSPTFRVAPTGEGVIVGTAAYMSPEQARGKKVDRRADIWAFGCVLYELLTGKQAFECENVTETLAAVLKVDPDWTLLPATTPAGIRVLLRRCLQKELARRLRDAADARIEIEDTLNAPAEPISAEVSSRPVQRWALFSGLACALAAVLAGFAAWNLKPSPSPAPLSVNPFTITLPAGQVLAGPDQPALAFSPDGGRLVYAAGTGGVQQLYLRAMDSLETKLIAGTEGAVSPFFSPDGQWVGFFAGGKLQKVSISGGAVATISGRPYPGGASWGSQRMIAFPPRINSALHQVPEAGGAAQPLTRLETGERIHTWPEFLPGGKAVLFVAAPNPGDTPTLVVQEIGTGERKNLVRNATQPRYAPPGYLVYAQGGTLLAAPFDPQRLALTGAAVPVEENIMQSPSSGAAQYSFSSTGSLIYVSGGIQGSQLRLVWVSRNGAEQPLTAPAQAYVHPRISPDGRRVALAIFGEQGTYIWIYDLKLETLTRLTFEGGGNNFPTWTPDARRIAFRSNRAGTVNLFWQLADGSGGLERLVAGVGNNLQPSSFSPDSQLLAFRDLDASTGSDIWVLRLSDQKVQPFLRTQFNEGGARFSPDGHWLAYSSDESGRDEIYVQPYPGPGGKWQISTEGGAEPTWNLNGRELFYRSGRKMMAVDVTTRPTFSAGKPKMLFEGQYQPTQSNQANYSVSPDGQRFLMLKPIEQHEQAATQINVVLNWFEELKRKVPLR